MNKRIRVVGIVVKDGNLLLVKGFDKYKEFWTPGGKLDVGESELKCLDREFQEELNVQLVSADFFGKYASPSPYHKNTITIQKVYITKISGTLKPSKEIQSYVWITREDYEKQKYPLIEITHNEIIPDLIKQGYF